MLSLNPTSSCFCHKIKFVSVIYFFLRWITKLSVFHFHLYLNIKEKHPFFFLTEFKLLFLLLTTLKLFWFNAEIFQITKDSFMKEETKT